MREKIEALEHHADLFTHLIDVCLTVQQDAIYGNRSLRRHLKIIHAAQQRAFAGAGRSDDNDNFLFFNGKINAFEHIDPAK